MKPLITTKTSIAATAGLALFLTGCASTGNSSRGTSFDRLMNAYEDLSGGRFVVIADFEKQEHLELVSIENASDKAKFKLNNRSGRPKTGRGAVEFTSGSESDGLIFNNAKSQQWFLKRDWRDYDLLIMSIKSPQAGLNAEVSISVGAEGEMETVHSFVALEQGWNLTRLDLADVADHVPLDNVNEVRISINGNEQPVSIVLDDLVLASNRETLYGQTQNEEGGIYVEKSGRRWHVGAGGRFELVFSHGQIVGWFNLEQDPYRQRNLVAGTTLSPMPVVLGDDSPGPGFNALGKAVRVHPKILEISDVRVVVSSEWIFVDDPDSSIEGRPFQKWLYTIYPSGQVFVSVACTARTADWAAPNMGLSIAMTAERADGIQTETVDDPNSPPTFATASSELAGYGVMFTLGRPSRFTRTQDRRHNGSREIAFIASGQPQESDVKQWVCKLALFDGKDEKTVSPQLLASCFWQPPDLDMQVGAVAEDGSPFLTQNGFDRAAGSYQLVPDLGTCRFTIAATDRKSYAPSFTILDSQGLDAWVYVDHVLYTEVARDREGNVVFELPGVVDKPRIVEVLTRKPKDPGASAKRL